MAVIRVGVQSPAGGAGQVVDLDGPSATIVSITNASGESVQYSIDGGSAWATLTTAASSGSLGIVLAGLLRMRKVASGAYPAPVDVDATINGLTDGGLTAAQVAATQVVLPAPSGDVTGATDSAAIEAAIVIALAGNRQLHVPYGTYVIQRDVQMSTGLHITMAPGAVIKPHDYFDIAITSNGTATATTSASLTRVIAGMHVLESSVDLQTGDGLGCTPFGLTVSSVGSGSITFSAALTASGSKTLRFYFRGNVITATTVTGWSIQSNGGWAYLDGNRTAGAYPYTTSSLDNVGNAVRIVNCSDWTIDGICGRNTRYHGMIAVGKLFDHRIGRWRGENCGYRALHYHGEDVGGFVNQEVARGHIELIECETTGVSAYQNQSTGAENSGVFLSLSNVAGVTVGTIRARDSYGVAVMLAGTNDTLSASNNNVIGAIYSEHASIALGFYLEARSMSVGTLQARGKYTKITGCATLDSADITWYYLPDSGIVGSYALRRFQLPAGSISTNGIRASHRLFVSGVGMAGGGLQIMKVSEGTGAGGTDLVWAFRDGGAATPYSTVASGLGVYFWTCRGSALYFDQTASTKQIRNIKIGSASLEWAGRNAINSVLSASEFRYRDISIGSLTVDGTGAIDQWNSFIGLTIGHYTHRNRTNGLPDESATLTGDVSTRFQNCANVTLPAVYGEYTLAGANNYIAWQFDSNCRNIAMTARGIHPSASAATIDCAIPSGAASNTAGVAGPLVLYDPRTKAGAQIAVSATGIVRADATAVIIVRPTDTP